MAATDTSKKWCYRRVDIYKSGGKERVFTLDMGAIVTVIQKYNSDKITWSEINHTYYSKDNKNNWVTSTRTGWVNDFYLDDYNEDFLNNDDLVKIKNPTQDPNDAKQYMMWAGVKQVNMCGELCVAYIVKNEIDANTSLESVLEKEWNKANITKGLNKDELKGIFDLYMPADQSRTTDNISAELNFESFKKNIKTHYLVALVTINNLGALIPQDIKKPQTAHWVVIEESTRNGWGVKLYNPFPNKFQEYSFDELVSSCRKSGLWIQRAKKLKETVVVDDDLFTVILDTPRPADYTAEQYVDREGAKKTELCGEFCAAYILGESIDGILEHWKKNPSPELREITSILRAYGCFKQENKSFTIGTVLDYWKMTQPKLYKHYVGANKPTGTLDLRSILKAYGYADSDLIEFADGLRDLPPKDAKYLPSPGRMRKMLETHFLIAGVGIDLSGKLIKNGSIRHWVVVEQIDPIGRYYYGDLSSDGNGGWVVLYNPFMNRREEYSYKELTNSMDGKNGGGGGGLWVKRNVQPKFEEQKVLSPPSNIGFWNWSIKNVKDRIDQLIISADQIITQLVFDFGLSRKDIATKLESSANSKSDTKLASEANDALKKLTNAVNKSLGVDSIDPKISKWISKESPNDILFAIDLALALRGMGVLVIENKKGVFSENPQYSSETVINLIGGPFATTAIAEIKDILI